ncbi:diphthine methyltransferase-like [Paramacrobiotus metropolitanus]|uniref:diphthine methyltransferase-like n=1 Tax=Paramacrobiotus metropolitanus TaxID=2943436 RepID=UPI00244632FB|nr:diphthine methyltransferase-like [Paramacrobiotus metropolitanus]
MATKRLASIDTDAYAAVCEYSQNGSMLYCGTYQLEGKESGDPSATRRVGSLLVVKNQKIVHQLHGLPGVLDVKTLDRDDIILAMADGTLRVVQNLQSERDDGLEHFGILEAAKIECTKGLALAVAWTKESENTGSILLAVSDSVGNVTILRERDEEFRHVQSSTLHEYEVWTVCFDAENSNIVYSGADDSLLKVTDSRMPDVARTVHGHEAGVTSIVNRMAFPSLLFTGSYDENLRVWDKRNLKDSVGAIGLGGGVWRIKQNPIRREIFACACMQGGARIVEYRDPDFVVLDTFMTDRQLVYGIDWSVPIRSDNLDSQKISDGLQFELAACSFYDHVLDFFSVSC